MNAAQLTTFSVRAAAVGAALWPAIVLIGGVEHAATLTEPSRSPGDLIPGAEEASGSLIARVAIALLPIAPAPYQALKWKRPGDPTWNSVVWWIEEVTPAAAEWRIACSPKN